MRAAEEPERMAGMNRTAWKVLLALVVAAASEMMPVLGMLVAFPLGGVHGDHPGAYLWTALIMNF